MTIGLTIKCSCGVNIPTDNITAIGGISYHCLACGRTYNLAIGVTRPPTTLRRAKNDLCDIIGYLITLKPSYDQATINRAHETLEDLTQVFNDISRRVHQMDKVIKQFEGIAPNTGIVQLVKELRELI